MSSQQENLITKEIVYITPPRSLLTSCSVPILELKTWGGILEDDLPALITALHSCNARMEALREWSSHNTNR